MRTRISRVKIDPFVALELELVDEFGVGEVELDVELNKAVVNGVM